MSQTTLQNQNLEALTVIDDAASRNTSNIKRKTLIRVDEKNVFTKVTKDDLIPEGKRKHEFAYIDEYLDTVFDNYARAYGKFFKTEIKKFEKKLETLKTEIMKQIADKKKRGGTGNNLNKSFTTQKSGQSGLGGLYEGDNSKTDIKRLQRDLENDNFPSLNALRAMGVNNFRPSCKYQTHVSSKYVRILK